MESRRFRTDRLDGLVAVPPAVSGLSFWVWCWHGGLAVETDPEVLITRGPALTGGEAARVSVYPEVGVVLDGPLVEADEGFGVLVSWLRANRAAIAGYWHQIGPVWAGDLLGRVRSVPPPVR
jgi:hypothetical protein